MKLESKLVKEQGSNKIHQVKSDEWPQSKFYVLSDGNKIVGTSVTGTGELYRMLGRMKEETMKKVKIVEDVQIPGTDIVLEAGDEVKIMDESFGDIMSKARSLVGDDNKGSYQAAFWDIVEYMADTNPDAIDSALNDLMRQ